MKIKIAFYIESMVVGGAERVLIDIVNNLDYKKFDVTVISIFKKSIYKNYSEQFEEMFSPNVHYKYLVDNTNKLKYTIFNYLFSHNFGSFLYRLSVKDRYDIEVAFYEGMPTDFVAKSSQNSKKFAWLHTNQQRLYENYNQEDLNKVQKKYTHFDCVFGVSNDVCKSFKKYFGNINVKTIYNPINAEKIKSLSKESINIIPNNTPLFISVGRQIKLKGYDRLINCFYQLKKEGLSFELWLVGYGDETDSLKNQIDNLNLQSEIKLLGHQNNPYSYVSKADYFVCSSYVEGLSTVVLEALALGVPIITTNCSGMSEIFGEYNCGCICDNNEKALYEALKQACNSHPSEDMLRQINIRNNYFSLSERISEIEKIFYDA